MSTTLKQANDAILSRMVSGDPRVPGVVAMVTDTSGNIYEGAAGERELAKTLRELGVEARRGQQFSGGAESPDVVAALRGIHIARKRVEALQLYPSLEQAKGDKGILVIEFPKDGGDNRQATADGHHKDRGGFEPTLPFPNT